MAIGKAISPKRGFPTKTLMVVLPLLMIVITYFISTFGQSAGYLVIVAAIGLVVAAIAILFPHIGFYFSMIFAFFMFDIQRFLQ
jgi:hypothetical protein